MQLNAIKVPFRWQMDASLLNSRNPLCKTATRYQLITPKDRLMPFIIRFTTEQSTALPSTWRVFNADTHAQVANLDALVATAVNYFRTADGWNYLVFNGGTLSLNLPSGYFYSVIGLEDATSFTSEDFWVDCDVAGSVFSGDYSEDFNEDFGPPPGLGGLPKYTKVEWWHTCDIGNLLYQTGFRNMLYINGDLKKGEPLILEDGKEDGNKEFVPTFLKYTDSYEISDFVPEHVLNAMQIISIHSHILVTAPATLYVARAKRFQVKQTPFGDCNARADISFQTEVSYYRSNCCDNKPIADVYNCNEVIGTPVFAGYVNGVASITWPVLEGTGNLFEITSSAISGGAPQTVNTNTYNVPLGPGSYVFEIRPRCSLSGGRVSYGTLQTIKVDI